MQGFLLFSAFSLALIIPQIAQKANTLANFYLFSSHYVGKVGSGVLHFFTYGLCCIGTIIDLISILSGGFRDSYGQPLV